MGNFVVKLITFEYPKLKYSNEYIQEMEEKCLKIEAEMKALRVRKKKLCQELDKKLRETAEKEKNLAKKVASFQATDVKFSLIWKKAKDMMTKVELLNRKSFDLEENIRLEVEKSRLKDEQIQYEMDQVQLKDAQIQQEMEKCRNLEGNISPRKKSLTKLILKQVHNKI